MPKRFAVISCAVVVMAALFSLQALAAPPPGPDAGNITVTNNLTGVPDTVQVSGLNNGDIVKVYGTATGSAPLGVAVAGGGTATVYVNQLGANGGSVHVSVKAAGSEESARTPKAFDVENKTDTPAADDITIDNRAAGTPDVITVENVSAGDIVRVYQNASGASVIAVAVSGGDTAVVYVNQLGINGGTVYISLQENNKTESARRPKSFDTELTAPPDAVTVENNIYDATDPTTRDTVTITGAAAGDIINIYKAASGTEKWAGPVPASGGSHTIFIDDLGKNAGKLFVTLTKPGKAESKRQSATIPPEPFTPALAAGRVTVTNNYGAADDKVEVFNLLENDVIKVYATDKAPAPIGTGTVAAGANSVEITLGSEHLSASGGTIYITRTTAGANESTRLAKKYDKETTAKPPPKANFTVTNNFGPANDFVEAKNLTAGDTVRVYGSAKGGEPIGYVEADAATEIIPLAAHSLSPSGGTVYISVATGSAAESARTPVSYGKEPVADRLSENSITVDNYYAAADAVSVSGLAANDVIKVYDAAKGGRCIGTGTADAVGTATATIDAGILKAAGGTVYVTVTTSIANESARTPKQYDPEPTTDAPSPENISVMNNYGMADVVIVSGLAASDKVKLFNSPTATAALAAVTADEASETIELPAGKLSANGGKLYVSVESANKNESPRSVKVYESEKTAPPPNGTVTVQNNYEGTDDLINVTGVQAGDVIKIYKAASGIDMWATTTAAGDTVTIEVPQLGPAAGKIHVTITKENKAESKRAAVPYLSEPVTYMEGVTITIRNNYNSEDYVIVEGVADGQTVTLYTAAKGSGYLQSALMTGDTYTFALDDGILAAKGGKLYVSVKNPTALESTRKAVAYTSEITAAPKAGNVLVVNYPGTKYDTVTMIGLSAGDTVRIYRTANDPNPMAVETVDAKGTTIVLEADLLDAAGKIYVTVTNEGKLESPRTAVSYHAAK